MCLFRILLVPLFRGFPNSKTLINLLWPSYLEFPTRGNDLGTSVRISLQSGGLQILTYLGNPCGSGAPHFLGINPVKNSPVTINIGRHGIWGHSHKGGSGNTSPVGGVNKIYAAGGCDHH